MLNGKRFRIFPTKAQQATLRNWIGCQRFIYNAKVLEDRYFRTFRKHSLALTGAELPIDQQYAHFIGPETAFLRAVPSQVLRNGAVRWRQAYQRFFAGAAKGRPKLKAKTGRQSLLLTSELFRLEGNGDRATLVIGTKKHPLGAIAVKAHRDFSASPKMVSVSLENGRWHVGFCEDDGAVLRSEAEIALELQQLGSDALAAVAEGGDRGVINRLATSSGEVFGLSEVQAKRCAREERTCRRWQKKKARRQNGSQRYGQAARKVDRHQRYRKDVARDVAHKTSRTLVDRPDRRLFVLEDLKVVQMTASARGTIEQPGRKVQQKAGLNRRILGSQWGRLKDYLAYKARRAGKLLVVVPAHHSSQECRCCGDTHRDNRLSQAAFVCQRCGHAEHADVHAAKVIKARGVKALLAGEIRFKGPRSCGIRKQLGSGRPEVTPGEKVSDADGSVLSRSLQRTGKPPLRQQALSNGE